jgi:hypothetical protein
VLGRRRQMISLSHHLAAVELARHPKICSGTSAVYFSASFFYSDLVEHRLVASYRKLTEVGRCVSIGLSMHQSFKEHLN